PGTAEKNLPWREGPTGRLRTGLPTVTARTAGCRPRPPPCRRRSAGLHDELDGRARLAVDLDVGEGRNHHQVDAVGSDVTARDGEGLRSLVDGPRCDGLNLGRTLPPKRGGEGTGLGLRARGGGAPWHLHDAASSPGEMAMCPATPLPA